MKSKVPSYEEYVNENASNDPQFAKHYPEIDALVNVWLGNYIIVNTEDDEEMAKYPILKRAQGTNGFKIWKSENQKVSLITPTVAYIDVTGAFSAYCIKK